MSSRTFTPQMSSSTYGQNSHSHSNPPAGIIQLESWSSKLASLTSHQQQSIDRLNDWLSPKSQSTSQNGAVRKQKGEEQNENKEKDRQQQVPSLALGQLPNGSSTNTFSNVTSTSQSNGIDATKVADLNATSTDPIGGSFQSLPSQPLQDPTAFLAYYSTLTTHLSNSTKSSNEIAINQLVKSTKETEGLLLELERVKVNLAELKAGIKAVEEADGLRERAEGMLERMDHLQNLSSSLSLRLSYFDVLQPSTILLSSPSLSLVLSPDFLHMLDRLDVALAFIRAHPHYRDSNLYKMRFEGCLIRAGTLIKMWITGKIKETGGAVSTSVGQKDGKVQDLTSKDALIHSKFDFLGRDSRVLISEVEKRAHPTLENDYSSEETQSSRPLQEAVNESNQVGQQKESEPEPERIPNPNAPEFSSLLSEIRVSYLSTRKTLLLPIVQSHFNKIATDSNTSKTNTLSPDSASGGSSLLEQLSSLILEGFEYLEQLGRIEREIFGLYFGLEEIGIDGKSREGPIRENEDSLRTYLEELSEPLYSILRPKIQRENEVKSLAKICSILLDLPTSSATLIKPILKETQNRLLTRAQNVCRNEIQDYKAKEGELDYPKRLLGTKEVDPSGSTETAKAQHRRAKSSIGGAGLLEAAAEAEAIERNDTALPDQTSTIRLFASPSSQVLSTWYPPLVKLLSLLSSLHQKVPSSSFTNFATSSISICRASLSRDYETLSQSTRMGENGFDPPLFYLRHLFLLREMVTSVELSSRPEQVSISKADWIEGDSNSRTDQELSSASALSFTTVVDALNSLWSNTGALFYPRNLYDLAARATNPASQGLESGTATPVQSEEASLKKPLSALERDIQRASTKLIDLVAAGSVLPLKMFLDHAAVKKLQSDQEQQYMTSKEISSKAETSVERARNAAQGFKTSSESTLDEAVESVRSYLEDEKVVKGIFDVVLQRILSTYSPFRKLVLATYGEDIAGNLPEDESMRNELEKRLKLEEEE